MSEKQGASPRMVLTPFTVGAGIIVIAGLVVTAIRFTQGLGSTTHLSDYNPWGIWIGFDLLCGVALAAGGYVTSSAVYLFGMKKYHSAVRPAILTGFLGYFFVVVALHYDLGRPWRLPYPFIVGFGTTSLLFEVGLCVALYLTVLFLEFSPAPLEWLGYRKTRNIVHRLTLVLTIFGATLSTLHQSSLGALFLIAPSKLHPLWYTSYLPVFFFVSSIIAGLSMVIFEGTLSHKFFHTQMSLAHKSEFDPLTIGFGKAASFLLAGYVTIKLVGLASGGHWRLLATPYGIWFLVEMIGFAALPCVFYAIGVRDKDVKRIRFTAAWTVLGIVLNRLNVSMIAFNWHLPLKERYFPSWMEIVISVFMVTLIILAYRFIVTRMPVLYEHPDFSEHNGKDD